MQEDRFLQIIAMATIPHSRPWINELVEYAKELRADNAALRADLNAARCEIARLAASEAVGVT